MARVSLAGALLVLALPLVARASPAEGAVPLPARPGDSLGPGPPGHVDAWDDGGWRRYRLDDGLAVAAGTVPVASAAADQGVVHDYDGGPGGRWRVGGTEVWWEGTSGSRRLVWTGSPVRPLVTQGPLLLATLKDELLLLRPDRPVERRPAADAGAAAVGKRLLALGTAQGVTVRELDGAAGCELPTDGRVTGLAFADDDRWLIAGGASGLLLVDPGDCTVHASVAAPAAAVTVTGDRVVAGANGSWRAFTLPDLRPVGPTWIGDPPPDQAPTPNDAVEVVLAPDRPPAILLGSQLFHAGGARVALPNRATALDGGRGLAVSWGTSWRRFDLDGRETADGAPDPVDLARQRLFDGPDALAAIARLLDATPSTVVLPDGSWRTVRLLDPPVRVDPVHPPHALLRIAGETVVAWDPRTGADLGRPLPVAARGGALSPDGRLAATWDGVNLAAWSTATGEPLWQARVGALRRVRLVVGPSAVALDTGRDVRVYDAESGAWRWTVRPAAAPAGGARGVEVVVEGAEGTRWRSDGSTGGGPPAWKGRAPVLGEPAPGEVPPDDPEARGRQLRELGFDELGLVRTADTGGRDVVCSLRTALVQAWDPLPEARDRVAAALSRSCARGASPLPVGWPAAASPARPGPAVGVPSPRRPSGALELAAQSAGVAGPVVPGRPTVLLVGARRDLGVLHATLPRAVDVRWVAPAGSEGTDAPGPLFNQLLWRGGSAVDPQAVVAPVTAQTGALVDAHPGTAVVYAGDGRVLASGRLADLGPTWGGLLPALYAGATGAGALPTASPRWRYAAPSPVLGLTPDGAGGVVGRTGVDLFALDGAGALRWRVELPADRVFRLDADRLLVESRHGAWVELAVTDGRILARYARSDPETTGYGWSGGPVWVRQGEVRAFRAGAPGPPGWSNQPAVHDAAVWEPALGWQCGRALQGGGRVGCERAAEPRALHPLDGSADPWRHAGPDGTRWTTPNIAPPGLGWEVGGERALLDLSGGAGELAVLVDGSGRPSAWVRRAKLATGDGSTLFVVTRDGVEALPIAP